MKMAFQTEVEFTLPRGYMDEGGMLHQEGVMRLATAADEILPLKDPRVQSNPAYLTVIVLSRVITKLGGLPDVNPRIVENLYASDVSFLQALYQKINTNGNGNGHRKVACPNCNEEIEVEDHSLGEV
jgi:hypothetical protein